MAIKDQALNRFVYYPIPKNASTTIKHWLFAYYKANGVDGFEGDIKRRAHKFFPASKKDGGKIGWFTGRQHHFAVVRDPIKRFISAYRNRVLHQGCLEKNPEAFVAAKLGLKPGLNEFVQRFPEYADLNREIAHHCAPQTAFIGKIFRRLDRVYDISELAILEQDLIRLTGFEQSFLVKQSGGKLIEVEELEETSRAFLQKYLQKDFDMLEDLGLGKPG